jgi:hypothetical protein
MERYRHLRGGNVFSIVLEAPNDMLGGGPIGTWITLSLRREGELVLMDREGNPRSIQSSTQTASKTSSTPPTRSTM